MKSNPIITDEMLAAYLAGNATAHEAALIIRAVESDPAIRETLRLLSEMESEETDVLPMMAMAADDLDKANQCAIKCEAYVLRKFGVETSMDNLMKAAQMQEWLKEAGTPLYNIGRLCEQHDLVASRRYECSIEDIKAALSQGKQVIAAVDTTGDGKPNHSVVVTALQDDTISIFDPDTSTDIDTLSVSVFEQQWATSHCYITIVSDAAIDEYDPHPIDLADVTLDPEMNELREAIAENAHEVWAAARKSQGWSYGPARNDVLKQTPDMVPYSRLTDEEKQYDRDMAENTIKLLIKLGWNINKK